MKCFSVILNGEGILIEPDSSDELATGFYTTRWVEASNSDQAIEFAKAAVSRDWDKGVYSGLNRGGTPVLHVDEVLELSCFTYWFRRKPNGYSFYAP